MIGKDDVSRLFATDVEAVLAHVIDDVAIPDLGPLQGQVEIGEEAFEPQVGHHRGDDAAADQFVVGRPLTRHQGHDLIAIDERALFIGNNHPIGIAVEGDADVGAVGDDLAAHGPG